MFLDDPDVDHKQKPVGTTFVSKTTQVLTVRVVLSPLSSLSVGEFVPKTLTVLQQVGFTSLLCLYCCHVSM